MASDFMGADGALFSDVNPVGATGLLTTFSFVAWATEAGMMAPAAGQRAIVTNSNFRIGMDLHIVIRVAVTEVGFSRVRLKPWWLRSNREFHAPGMSAAGVVANANYLDVDSDAFGALVGNLADTNRVWAASEKRSDVIGPARHSTTIWLDDIWQIDIDAASATFDRTIAFFYPAHGRALALTGNYTHSGGETTQPTVQVAWHTGKSATGGGS
jgi:hypothetical protein